MTKTTATQQQSDAIKQRMAEIRSDLPYAADRARNQISQWTDWRYHAAKRPWPILVAAVAAGYLIVPSKRRAEPSAADSRFRQSSNANTFSHGDLRAGASNAQPAKRGLAAGIIGTVATLAMKQATSMAAAHIGNLLTHRDDQ